MNLLSGFRKAVHDPVRPFIVKHCYPYFRGIGKNCVNQKILKRRWQWEEKGRNKQNWKRASKPLLTITEPV